MSIFAAECKGTVHVLSESGQGGRTTGFYQLEPAIPSANDSMAVIRSIPLSFQEIVQPSITLDDRRTLYVYGSAWNETGVNGVLLLGNSSTRGAQLDRLLQWYEENRVSQKMGPVMLSLGTTAVDAYVVGLRVMDADPMFNKQEFSILMVTPKTS